MFSGLWLENVRFSSISFRQLWKDCIYVSIGMFWGKQMISERDVFFGEFNWKILDLRWSFSTGLSKQHSKCPEESFERFIIGKTFQVNYTYLEKSAVGFSELKLACRAFWFWEKLSLLFWKPKTLLFKFGFGAKKNLPYFQKTSESSVLICIKLSRLKFCWKVRAKSFEIFVRNIIGKLLKVDST